MKFNEYLKENDGQICDEAFLRTVIAKISPAASKKQFINKGDHFGNGMHLYKTAIGNLMVQVEETSDGYSIGEIVYQDDMETISLGNCFDKTIDSDGIAQVKSTLKIFRDSKKRGNSYTPGYMD